MTGYIPLTSISDQITKTLQDLAEQEVQSEGEERDEYDSLLDLSKIFTVGQYLRAAVVSTVEEITIGTKMKRHIELSIKPQQANAGLKPSDLVVNGMIQAAVRSKEDRGLVMDLGIDDGDVRGFLGSRELGLGMDIATIEEGAVYLCLMTGKSSDGRTIKLSLDPQKISTIRKAAFVTDGPSVDSFLPGTAVEVLVSEVTSSGLHGKVMGLLDVTADMVHSGAASSNKDREIKYPVGSKAKARIVCTFPTSEQKKLGVSLQDHILYWRSKTVNETSGPDSILPLSLLPISSIVKEAKVAKVDPGNGLYLDIGVKGVRGFAHISKLAESRVETVSESIGPYKVGSVHKARVIGYNLMDGLFILSLEPKIINQPFLFLEDVTAGQIVKGTVQKLLVGAEGVSGIILDLGNGISGLVPDVHLADVRLQHPERKFREGMTVTARVLYVDSQRHQIRLTLKKSLVNSDEEPWKDYESLKPGMHGPGTLINILSNGAVVQFYGSIRAFLPVSEMSESFIQDPKQHFQKGQVVNVHITSLDAQERRMTVSCRDHSTSGASEREAVQALTLGSKVCGKVSEKTAGEVIIELEGSGLKATLPFEHLVDGSTKKAEAAAKRIRVGQVLKDLIVLNKKDIRSVVQLSSKPSLVKAAEKCKLLQTIDDVVEGADVSGYVNNITTTGIFVRFAGELTGLLLKHHIEEDAAKLPDYGYRRHESISARVLAVDHSQSKFLLTRKPVKDSAKGTSINGVSNTNASPLADSKLLNPVDATSNSVEDYTIGRLTKAKIVSIKETQINVQLADGVQGRIDVSEIFDTMEDVSDRKHPLKKFRTKMIIPVRILGMHDPRNHRFLPITHRQGGASVFELTAKPSSLNAEQLDIMTISKIEVGSSWLATVNNIAEDCLWVNLSPNLRGRIRAMDVSDDVSLLRDLATNFPIGSILKVKVLRADSETNHLDLTARSSGSSKSVTLQHLSTGMVLPGRVTKVTDRQVMVQLDESLAGAVHLVDMADDYSKADPKAYQKNQTVRVSIKKVDRPNKRIILTTRPSKVLSSSLPVRDQDITSFSQLVVNDIIRGFVKNVADNGVFISLATDITGFVRVSDLSDHFIKDWKAGFEVDQLVEGKIIALDPLLNHVQMSLKRSHLDKDYTPPLTFADMEVGLVVTGKIRKVEDFGVFIVVDNSANVSGLCHKTKMSNTGADPRKLYEEGDAVQAKILNINTQKRQISFGLKPSYFDNAKVPKEPAEDVEDGNDDGPERDADDASMSAGGGVEVEGLDFSEEDDDENNDDSPTDGDIATDLANGVGTATSSSRNVQSSSPTTVFKGLSTGKIDWTGGMETFNDVHSGDDAPSEASSSATSQHHAKKKKKRKASIHQTDRTGDLDAHGPQSAADFERLLLSQPHSSVLWLRYMAFHLSLSEPSTARAIAERALATIPLSLEAEKQHVWIALLNLESAYGTADTLAAAFTRACQHNDPLEIHTALISIHIQSSRLDEADTLFQTTLQRHSPAPPSLYENYAAFLFTHRRDPARARALLPRAMQSLPAATTAHVALTARFAQLEFKLADPERGRTMFETLLQRWPKRWDLWSVWVDMEIGCWQHARARARAVEKGGDSGNSGKREEGEEEKESVVVVRRLFERITMGGVGGGGDGGAGERLKPRKARVFFKKWLEWEGKVGDGKGKERVEALAREYVKVAKGEKGGVEAGKGV